MKAASDNLIAFLASGKAFVMWDTFTFTLADGTELVYTTRDPDAPPLPVELPPSSYDNTYLLDTFDGTGNLSTHQGQAGANWPQFISQYATEDDPTKLDRFQLIAGVLQPETFETNGFMELSFNPSTANESGSYFVAANVSFSTNGFSPLTLYLADVDFLTYGYVSITPGNSGNGPRLFVSGAFYGVAFNDTTAGIETSYEPDGSVVELKMVINNPTAVSPVLLLQVNGVTAWAGVIPGDMLNTLERTFLFISNTSGVEQPLIYNISGGGLA